MNDMSHGFREGRDRLADDLRAVVGDAEALLRHAVRDAGAGYEQARTRLEESIATAKTELTAAERELLQRVRDAGRATNDYVHHNPWPAIGAGVGAGLLVGLLLGRR